MRSRVGRRHDDFGVIRQVSALGVPVWWTLAASPAAGNVVLDAGARWSSSGSDAASARALRQLSAPLVGSAAFASIFVVFRSRRWPSGMERRV
jgi:hypothetical protein